MELESAFEEPNVLGSSLSNYVDLWKVIIVFLEVDVPPGVSETTSVKLHGTSSPQH
jgi:hypothetical protein